MALRERGTNCPSRVKERPETSRRKAPNSSIRSPSMKKRPKSQICEKNISFLSGLLPGRQGIKGWWHRFLKEKINEHQIRPVRLLVVMHECGAICTAGQTCNASRRLQRTRLSAACGEWQGDGTVSSLLQGDIAGAGDCLPHLRLH